MDKEKTTAVNENEHRPVWHAPVIETVALERTLWGGGSGIDGSTGTST